MSAADILVVILSTALAILLILSIILVVLLIRVTKKIQALTDSANNIVEGVGRFTTNVSTLVAPATLFNLARKVFKVIKHKR